MVRTRRRPVAEGRMGSSEGRAIAIALVGRRSRHPVGCREPHRDAGRARHARVVRVRLHAAEAAHLARHRRGRGAGRAAAADRLGRGTRHGRRSRALGALSADVPLAAAALPGDRVDLSRGLRPRRSAHALGRRSRRRLDGRQATLWAATLVPFSVLPYLIGLTGPRLRRRRDRARRGCSSDWRPTSLFAEPTTARRSLFYGSITYLPLLWLLMVVGKKALQKHGRSIKK